MIIDLDKTRPPEQRQLVKEYYKGYIPHVVVLDGSGTPSITTPARSANRGYQAHSISCSGSVPTNTRPFSARWEPEADV